ncbi:hypothetical protein [Sphingobacterium bovisgrunnientis]|uniref:hypothetical protein n=1 Tax=Sphingobacterium bovisgrunnientis TaxID=1874697 RepID=UPI00135C5B5F|nr:hypothetical protein [Sphingobacterium bovisgrunnientis]
MVAEKMKLKILEAISWDLAKHVDTVFNDLLQKDGNTDFSINDIIEDYLKERDKPIDLLESNVKIPGIVEIKRDIAFIYYCLCCPFYYSLGVDQRLTKEQTKILLNALKIHPKKYITSAKHYYRIYSDYRDMINSFVLKYIKKE